MDNRIHRQEVDLLHSLLDFMACWLGVGLSLRARGRWGMGGMCFDTGPREGNGVGHTRVTLLIDANAGCRPRCRVAPPARIPPPPCRMPPRLPPGRTVCYIAICDAAGH
jgi:hypothetical protein